MAIGYGCDGLMTDEWEENRIDDVGFVQVWCWLLEIEFGGALTVQPVEVSPWVFSM